MKGSSGVSKFSRLLLDWYTENARSLPWRGSRNPYAVWISEIMLQQTRVETVIPYYQRWMKRYPDLASLAQAEQQEVLQIWEGLGYYSRARNIHRTARIINDEYEGKFPQSVRELEKLPGIGAYSSRAIASIAFGLDEATLDGNIRRVLSRVFNMQLPARSNEGKKQLWRIAQENLPAGKAAAYNQALMDLGATVCLPRRPACASCPSRSLCYANQHQITARLPNLEKPPPVPHYIVSAAVIRKGNKVLITQRPQKGLLGGLWEFPGGKQELGETLEESLHREIEEELGARIHIRKALGTYTHAYTHFRVTVHAFECSLKESEPKIVTVADMRWVNPRDTLNFPMGKVDRLISRDLIASQAEK